MATTAQRRMRSEAEPFADCRPVTATLSFVSRDHVGGPQLERDREQGIVHTPFAVVSGLAEVGVAGQVVAGVVSHAPTLDHVDVDSLNHLDWDHEPYCEAPHCAGDRGPVTHRSWLRFCGCPFLLICVACANHLVEHSGDWLPDPRCLRCSLHGPAARLGDFVGIEPIR